MDFQRRIVCPDNEELVAFMKNKWQDIAQNPKGISDNLKYTVNKAYSNVCNSRVPIKSLKDLAEVEGVGKWILRQMKGFFDTDSIENEDVPKRGRRNKGARSYVPQKNSVAYALLITLYREMENGKHFMHKQELISAAEASGLSRTSIVPEVGKGKPGRFGSSPQSWYSGWSCMKTLITKGLVVKSNCPAKYMLTEEGKEAALECLSRSRFVDQPDNSAHGHIISGLEPRFSDVSKGGISDSPSAMSNSSKEASLSSFHINVEKKSIDIPPESLNKFIQMGFSREQTVRAFLEASETSKTQDISSLWPAVLCRLKEDQIYGGMIPSKASDNRLMNTKRSDDLEGGKASHFVDSDPSICSLRGCFVNWREPSQSTTSALARPPLEFGETFEDAYEVILILDDRERFANQKSNLRNLIENVSTQFKTSIQVRRLPVGDAIWVARHKCKGTEYVLDFVVERKRVGDLRVSIRDNRYKDQKLRLLRCGLKKVIYIVEGDPNFCEAAESIKTACFTTEILEGFDVQRTGGLGDTMKKYGYLSQAINHYYKSLDFENKSSRVCPPYGSFIRRCEDLDKMTVSDVLAIQLMQVPQVTEEIAIAVVEMYPTLISLVRAYSLHDGDSRAQEEMLKKQSNNIISGAASRNIFQLIWGNRP